MRHGRFRIQILAVLLFFSQWASAASSTIGILVFDGFLTSDVAAPIEVFGAATKKSWFSSFKVILVSATKNKNITSEEGLKIVADSTIYDNLTLDVLVAPSAYDMDPFLKNADLINFIRAQATKAKWMTSNCSGAFLLAEAGVLDGKNATTWAGGEEGLQKAYPKVRVKFDQNLVVDKGVITSNGGPVSFQAAFALLDRLASEKFSQEISEQIQFNRLKRAFGT